MNTPSNAGKELKCPCCHRPVRLQRWDESEPTSSAKIQCIHGDCLYPSTGWRNTPEAAIEAWNRRTTPPTQSQEGEKSAREFVGDWLWESEDRQTSGKPWGSQYIRDAAKMAELYAESKLTTAQRENDRLRSEVVMIEWQNQEKLTVTWNHLHGAFIVQGVNQVCGNMGRGPTVIEALRAARAATEEGKRG